MRAYKAFRASSTQTVTASRVMPRARAFSASRRASRAARAWWRWRSVKSIPAPGSKLPAPNRAVISSCSSSSPSPETAEMHATWEKYFRTCSKSILEGRSVLFTTATAGMALKLSANSKSSRSNSWEESNTASTRSAVCTRSRAAATPMLSTGSSVSRRPAVSASRRGIPPSSTVSSTTSRVVPAYWVTMDRWHPASRFIRVDFPALGRPAITVRTPSRYTFPTSKLSSSRESSWAACSRLWDRAWFSTAGTSSSGKSAQAARCAPSPVSSSRMAPTRWDRAPLLPAWASRAACSPPAPMSSITASAWVRSIFPLRKARRVNSPGWAGEAPAASTSWSRRRVIYSPPWQESSTTSSPV